MKIFRNQDSGAIKTESLYKHNTVEKRIQGTLALTETLFIHWKQ